MNDDTEDENTLRFQLGKLEVHDGDLLIVKHPAPKGGATDEERLEHTEAIQRSAVTIAEGLQANGLPNSALIMLRDDCGIESIPIAGDVDLYRLVTEARNAASIGAAVESLKQQAAVILRPKGA